MFNASEFRKAKHFIKSKGDLCIEEDLRNRVENIPCHLHYNHAILYVKFSNPVRNAKQRGTTSSLVQRYYNPRTS